MITQAHCQQCGSVEGEDLYGGDQGYTACCNERVVDECSGCAPHDQDVQARIDARRTEAYVERGFNNDFVVYRNGTSMGSFPNEGTASRVAAALNAAAAKRNAK